MRVALNSSCFDLSYRHISCLAMYLLMLHVHVWCSLTLCRVQSWRHMSQQWSIQTHNQTLAQRLTPLAAHPMATQLDTAIVHP
jgi:hypothetical protein